MSAAVFQPALAFQACRRMLSNPSSRSFSSTQQSVKQFHRDIDTRVAEIVARNHGRLKCGRGCSGCCDDNITVFEVEANQIRSAAHHRQLLATGMPHPDGACAFLDHEGMCRVYDVRPYVCRTQGLPLRWIDHEEATEFRDICPLNEDAVDGAEYPTIVDLPEDDCWTIGEAEERLRNMQAEFQRGSHDESTSDGPLTRIRLRDLFARQNHCS